MPLDLSRLDTINPSEFIEFTTPNIINCCYIRAPLLRIAILDSPLANPDDDSPRIAALIVPQHRERDWNFGTEYGHFQLLYHFNVSRLILIGNNLDPDAEPLIYTRPPVINPVDKETIEDKVKQLVVDFHPKVSFRNGSPQPLFLTYEDDVLYRVILEKPVGPSIGEFLVEDVELESKEFRRRLRFRRMPNAIQSQVPLIPRYADGECNLELDLESLRKMKEVELQIDTRVLVESYLAYMVSGIFLIASPLDERMKQGISPRALCFGVGGGSLLSFLNSQLEFQIVGVEIDEAVLSTARKYFGLNDGPSVKLIVGDAIELLEKVSNDSDANIDGLNAKFDVVMVNLFSEDARSLMSVPPPAFVRKAVFRGMRSLLHNHGVLVIHVISPDKLFYASLVEKLKEVFHKVYVIDSQNDWHHVLMATLTPVASNDHSNAFSERLRSVIPATRMISLPEL